MCSTNPANWITFDDEPLFQSPQKSAENQSSCRANGLKLNLSNVPEPSSRSSSTGSTPLSSPVVDFYLSPGPPSNSPLTTPTRDYPGSPCIPKAGIHILYPVPEWPSKGSFLPSPGVCASLTSQKLSSLPVNTLTDDNPVKILVSKSKDEGNPNLQESCDELGEPSERFPYFQDDCAFSSPFWKDGCLLSTSAPNVNTQRKDKALDRNVCHSKEKETCHDQKSLTQGSFSYVCERLEHLQTDSSDTVGRLPAASAHVWHNLSSAIAHGLFRSQKADGWPFMLRIPEKKNMMSSRQWGPIYLKVLAGGILQMYYEKGLEKPFKEFQLQPHCKLSEPKLESYSVSGKIHTVKIECVSYTEKRKYHPKVEVIHEPEVEQMLKLGTTDYNDFTDFLVAVEEELMKLPTPSKQKRNYEEQEMTLEIVDNFWGKITKAEGKLVESAVITHIYCLCFVNGSTDCFLTLNDLELQKKDERYFEKEKEKKWIGILDYHFHNCVKTQEFKQSRIIKFTPPDACRLELMRFKTQYNGQDLPFSVKAAVVVQGAYIELQAFINMSSTALIPTRLPSMKCCENVMIRFPVPAQWIKALWTMNLQRQKSLKAKMNRRTCLGSLHEIESDPVIQVSVGTAKYESAYRAVVWKIDRLPDKNSSSDHPHSLSYKLELGSDQEIPSDWYPFATVQFVIHDACASGTEVKSLGIESDVQPQKHVIQKAFYNCQPKLYRSIIEDVIEGVRELFAEEGIEEQVLKDLKQLWETKVMQSKATEGFFRHSHHSPQFTLQLPHSFHRALQASAASLVIPTGRGFQHFTAADLVCSSLTLPSGIAYPLHVPAGVTLQTASGHLYKVNVPVMVTQAPGDARILQHPIQQIFQQLGQPSVLQANIASVAQVNASSVQATAETLQPQKPAAQQTVVFQPSVVEGKHLENSAKATLVQQKIQQPTTSQQQIATNATLNQQEDLTEKSQYSDLHTAVFTSESSQVFSPGESLASNPSSVLPDVEGQLDTEPQELVQQQVSDDIIEMIIMGNSLDDNAVRKDQDSVALADKQMESNSRTEKDICSDIEGIIQLDGTGDVSPKEEIAHTKDMEENEFIGIIESEDLKVLEDEDEEEEEGESLSNTESSSSSGENEEPQIDIVEEDPLNSGDDVSEQDTPDLFDTDNVIVCQYDKIHRSKNKWKFYLKDGVMCFGGKDYVFAKAIGDAEW
ncbi:Stonin-1 [Struthio camelus australis]|uniref:Stonin-1 n=1 Tax=Struthio camelus australis TaxID=441894 RepID=A0A093H751_STRCA|nr:Stonin-1 [Struthio camelus australis]